jgi:rhamnose utilization protein RhaD (predicted bifunctional aldolase and dehydrogenase)
MSDVLNGLIGMTTELGAPAHDFAILGEGNASARADEDTFWVKASGVPVGTAGRDGFVRVRFAPILEAMDGPMLDDAALKEVLNITHMLVKTCRVLAHSLAVGGPRFLSPAQADRIDKRPDELARRQGFV